MQIVRVEVIKVLGADDELLAVGGEVRRLDGEVGKVDGLHLGVAVAVDLKSYH